VGGKMLDLRGKALLCLHRHNARAGQRGPDCKEATVGAEIDDLAASWHRQPAA
jgi:hypothetical protein